jgi:hypothetical protein
MICLVLQLLIVGQINFSASFSCEIELYASNSVETTTSLCKLFRVCLFLF